MPTVPSPAPTLDSDLGPALSELTALLLSDERIEQLLDRVTGLAVEGLAGVTAGGVTAGGITVSLDGAPRMFSATDAQAGAVAGLQYDTGDGPGVEALRTGEIVTVEDFRGDNRWGAFGDGALSLGFSCVLSLPLEAADRVVGVLDLYGAEPHDFTQAEVRGGRFFAWQAGLVLTAAARYRDQVELTAHLQSALTSRAVIDQAIGVVMAMHHCTPAEGFERLRETSQHRNVKLRLIAAETIATVQASATLAPASR